ncbi:MAG: GNAT family N-acetyltransferase [Candidatus Paceibacterota bacterium]
MDKKDVIMLVAEAENEIVDFIIVNVNLSLKKSEIENIYVLDSFRNQKIGSQLVTEVIKESKKIGVENICFLSSKDHSF